jgi:hypothetical protein
MTSSQAAKIESLIDKYNDILLISMRLAIAEDFVNLIVVNREDTDFELNALLKDKTAFSNHVLREFLRKNSSTVVAELKQMESPVPSFKNKLGNPRKK